MFSIALPFLSRIFISPQGSHAQYAQQIQKPKITKAGYPHSLSEVLDILLFTVPMFRKYRSCSQNPYIYFTVTIHFAVFLLPSFAFTVIVTLPFFLAVTRPDADTVATFLFEAVYFTVLFPADFGPTVAFNKYVPFFLIVTFFLFSLIVLTGFATVTEQVA